MGLTAPRFKGRKTRQNRAFPALSARRRQTLPRPLTDGGIDAESSVSAASNKAQKFLNRLSQSEPRFEWFPAPDGVRLRAAVWGEGPPARVCVVLTGLTEWIEKYEEVAGELLARGFTVAGFDWRGQGQSARILEDARKAHVTDFAEFDADLAAFLDQIVKPLGGGPRIALAHSMGAHILLRRLHDQPQEVAAAVLCAPMLRVHTGQYPMWFTRVLTTLFNFHVPSEKFVWGTEERDPLTLTFSENRVTSDPARFEQSQKFLREHPEIRVSGPTFGWLGAAFKSMDKLHAPGFAEAITTPLLVVGARKDQIVDVEAIHDYAPRLPNARYFEIAEAEHEILMESHRIRAQFWAVFDAFVKEELG
jgi:lysophospholipase